MLRGCAPLTPRYVNTANVKKLAEISYRVITINRVNTSNGGTKPATLSTGATIKGVPLFINIGDVLKIDTRTGEYVSRAKG